MTEKYSEQQYGQMLENLFARFPSFQLVGTSAYNPGLDKMLLFDQLMEHPHKKFKIIHVAGTNGKGSVSSMLTSVLSASGLRTGLFTSPHILDFRERARIVSNDDLTYISKDYIWEFCQKWMGVFDSLDLSLFEISTMMAFKWFEEEAVDVAVIETGLGGRLDSTNIATPILSVITNIGLDHCNILGETLQEIAFEKAGIIKPCVPVVVGESNPETDEVFKRKVLYTNLSEQMFMGNREAMMSLLTFADKVIPEGWGQSDELIKTMDLQGAYQKYNLRTVLAALDRLVACFTDTTFDISAISQTAARTDFHGRWEQLSDCPRVICDIAHNDHGLLPNMRRLSEMIQSGEHDSLIIVFGMMSDKEFERIAYVLPMSAEYVFTSAPGPRALKAEALSQRFVEYCNQHEFSIPAYHVEQDPALAYELAQNLAQDHDKPLIYVGGSTYVVAEIIKKVKRWI